MRFSFIIPAYNEAQAIRMAIERTARYALTLRESFEIVVVDDGSPDETAVIVEACRLEGFPVILKRHERNLGKGAAIKTGMAAASGEWRIFLDADLSTAPEEFESFRPVLHESDVVIGSRAAPGARILVHQPLMRELTGRSFNLIIRALFGLPFRDTQCGFKCFHQRTVDIFRNLETRGWAFDVELLVRARKQGFRIREVPIDWRDDPTTTVHPRDAWRIIRDLLRIKFCLKIDSKETLPGDSS